MDEASKNEIIKEIEADFAAGYEGIQNLPIEAKFGVYTAYVYYKKLLSKLKKTPSLEIKNNEIEIAKNRFICLTLINFSLKRN